MLKSAIAALCILAAGSSAALSADPILGKWRAPGGGIVRVSNCGGAYCAKVISGRHAGKDVGQMRGSNGRYDGTVTDPRDDKTYSGRATVAGDRLQLKGCALKIFCKTQNWTRI